MKKRFALLLALALLLSLSATAAADGDGRSLECDNVLLTVTGCCTTPGADGAPRLTLFLSAGNKNDTARVVHAEGCVIGPCELPVNFSLTLEAWESWEAMLVIPLTALSFFDLSDFNTDYIRLRLSVSAPGAEPVSAAPLTLHTGSLPKFDRRECTDTALFARFGVRILALGADWDGRFLTGWFLVENNNDFPLRLNVSVENGAISGGDKVAAHTRAVMRADFPTDARPTDRNFTLRCAVEGYADGAEKPPVSMASFQAPLTVRENADGWTLAVGTVESENDQSYIARVGLRDFHYDECLPLFEINPDAPVLPARESGLVSLACCGGYEILADDERAEGTRAVLPLTMRSFTGEALSLRVGGSGEGLSLPCLTAEALQCPANGSAEADFVFDAGGLAYTALAGAESFSHSFMLSVSSSSDESRIYGFHPAEFVCAVDEIEPLEPCAFEETSAGALRFQLLGLDLTDGLSVWLRVQNSSAAAQPFGEERVEGMLNSSVVSFVNSGNSIPAHADTLVLLRAAAFDDDGSADPFAYRLPPLSELNTLKLRLGPEEDARSVTVMFQHNGNIMLASASAANVPVLE